MTNDHEAIGESDQIETLASKYGRRAAILDHRDWDLSRKDTAWLAEPHNDLVATPATTARDFAAKIVAHAHLLGIRDDGECMSIVEASAIRDAHALLGASVALAHTAPSRGLATNPPENPRSRCGSDTW